MAFLSIGAARGAALLILTFALTWHGVAGAAPSSATAAFPIPPHTATYELRRGNSAMGRVEVSLGQDNGEWLYQVETVATSFSARLLGLGAREQARFRWQDGAIQPLEYRHTLSRPGRDRYWNHDFDWREKVSRTRTWEGDHRIPLKPGVLDPLTLRLAMSLALHAPAARAQNHPVRVLERDEVEDQQFRHQGEERLELASRCLDTVRFERFRREGSSRNYLAWHSEPFHWMPVRILQVEDDSPQLDIRLVDTSLDLGDTRCPP